MTKEYGVYDLEEYEQLIFSGTLKEVAKYLQYNIESLRSYLTRKKQGKQKLLQHRYELVEIIEDELTEEDNIFKSKITSKEFWRKVLEEFTEKEPSFKTFDQFNWDLKGLFNEVIEEDEVWKNIPNFEYSISNYGRIKNEKTKKLKNPRYHRWILQIDLYKDGKRYTVNLPRLEANIFIRTVMKNEKVIHIDGDSRNNFYKNLKIVSKE